MGLLMDNQEMKFKRNWLEDESISDEEKLAYFDSLDDANVMNIFEKIEADRQAALAKAAELEKKINERKKLS